MVALHSEKADIVLSALVSQGAADPDFFRLLVAENPIRFRNSIKYMKNLEITAFKIRAFKKEFGLVKLERRIIEFFIEYRLVIGIF